jgi:hypothetical protein
MTPEEWERCADPQLLLEALRVSERASARKLRLLAVACCRRAWHLLTEPCQRALETAEQFADGQVPDARRKAARGEAFRAKQAPGFSFTMPGLRLETAGALAKQAVCEALAKKTWFYLGELDVALGWDAWAATNPPAIQAYWRDQTTLGHVPVEHVAEFQRGTVHLVRDIVGNPFRPPTPIIPAVLAYNGGAASRLAEVIYDGRRFEDLPVLADLLEEAGCTDAALLGHLRGPGPHVLGCHALDAVLGKS